MTLRNSGLWFAVLLVSLLFHAATAHLVHWYSSRFSHERLLDPFVDEQNKSLPIEIVDIPIPRELERPKDPQRFGQYDTATDVETIAPQVPAMPQRSNSSTKQPLDLFDFESSAPQFTPAPQVATPGSLSFPQEFLPNIRVGERTYLNVQSLPESTFLIRMKRAFRIAFRPSLVFSQLTSEQRRRNRIEAIVGFVLGESGELLDLRLLQGSDSEAFNREVLRMVRVSAPFTKPPAALFTEGQRAPLAWHIHLYL